MYSTSTYHIKKGDFFFANWPHFFGVGELEKRFTKSCFGFCGGPVLMITNMKIV